MPLKKNSPKWHGTANRRQGLWEQFFTISSLLFCECWRCSTTGVRNLLKACSKSPSGSSGSVFSIAIIRLPGQLIQKIDCSLPKPLAAAPTESTKELWESAAPGSVPGAAHNLPWANERLTSHFCVQRDTLQCKVISCIENVPLFVTATLLPLQVCRVLSWALCFKEQAKVLWVFLAWCLQPLAASSVWHSHPSEHETIVAPCTQKRTSRLKGAHRRGGKKRNVCQCARGSSQLLEFWEMCFHLFSFFWLKYFTIFKKESMRALKKLCAREWTCIYRTACRQVRWHLRGRGIQVSNQSSHCGTGSEAQHRFRQVCLHYGRFSICFFSLQCSSVSLTVFQQSRDCVWSLLNNKIQ